MISIFDVIIRYGSYYSEMQMMLVRLEDLVRPRTPPSLEIPTFSFPPPIGPLGKKTPTLLETINDHLAILEKDGAELKLKRTQDRIGRIRDHLKSVSNTIGRLGDDKMVHEIRVLREALEDDLRELRIFIPSIEQAEFHARPKLFEDKVYTAFPSARQDILEAGNCYATDNFTACIFHLMRVGERGMRVLARHLKVKKVGKVPLEYSEWGPVCKALQKKVDELQQKGGRGEKKASRLKRYADAASQAEYLNEIWRKDVSHARCPYNQPEAQNALIRVREFMQSLAEWLAETKQKN